MAQRTDGDGALDSPVVVVTTRQAEALRALHAYLDRQAVSGPGQPDTPALKEARDLRTALEQAFPDAFPPPTPIVTAST